MTKNAQMLPETGKLGTDCQLNATKMVIFKKIFPKTCCKIRNFVLYYYVRKPLRLTLKYR